MDQDEKMRFSGCKAQVSGSSCFPTTPPPPALPRPCCWFPNLSAFLTWFPPHALWEKQKQKKNCFFNFREYYKGSALLKEAGFWCVRCSVGRYTLFPLLRGRTKVGEKGIGNLNQQWQRQFHTASCTFPRSSCGTRAPDLTSCELRPELHACSAAAGQRNGERMTQRVRGWERHCSRKVCVRAAGGRGGGGCIDWKIKCARGGVWTGK